MSVVKEAKNGKPDKARTKAGGSHLRHLFRTVLFRVVPLLAASAALQANVLYDFGASVSYGCGATGGSCTGSGAGVTTLETATLAGNATLYTTSTVSETDASGLGDIVTLHWSGTGDTLPASIVPLAWDFSIAGVGTATNVMWELEFILGPTTYYDSGLQAAASSNSGLASITIPSGAASESWTVDLKVDYQLNGNPGGVTISIPEANGGIEVGVQAPEPATWSLAGGVLLALMMARRKLRRQ